MTFFRWWKKQHRFSSIDPIIINLDSQKIEGCEERTSFPKNNKDEIGMTTGDLIVSEIPRFEKPLGGEMKIEVGKTYVTRGGWKAKVIWQARNDKDVFYVIHKPGEKWGFNKDNSLCNGESCPITHRKTKPSTSFSVDEAPDYGLHPAELIEECE